MTAACPIAVPLNTQHPVDMHTDKDVVDLSLHNQFQNSVHGSIDEELLLAASRGHVDTVLDLLKSGSSFCLDSEGCSPLMTACTKGSLDVVNVLLEADCAVNCTDKSGNSAFHEAAWRGFSRTVQLLIKYNANVFSVNKSGFTALHLATQNGHNESCRILLYGGVHADIQNNFGDTALHTAVRYGHAGVTRILISAKCNLDVKNKNGDSALHIASALKRNKIAKMLVESQADVFLCNEQNESALDIARRKKYPSIMLIITSSAKASSPRMRQAHTVTFRDNADIGRKAEVKVDGVTENLRRSDVGGFLSFFKKKKKVKEKILQSTDATSSSTHLKRALPAANRVQPESSQPVAGFFSQYVPQSGTQYYKDLAGNVKQGPVGYKPVCQCDPTLHHIEHTMRHTKEQLYDHINISHQRHGLSDGIQMLRDRIEQLDLRTSQQVHSLDHVTRERLEAERCACCLALEKRTQKERQRTQNVVDACKAELSERFRCMLTNDFTDHDHCFCRHHDDLALPVGRKHFDQHVQINGAQLKKTRSDETLSASDRSGKRRRKRDFYASRKAAMEQIRGWAVAGNAEPFEAKSYQADCAREFAEHDIERVARVSSMETSNLKVNTKTALLLPNADVHYSTTKWNCQRKSPVFGSPSGVGESRQVAFNVTNISQAPSHSPLSPQCSQRQHCNVQDTCVNHHIHAMSPLSHKTVYPSACQAGSLDRATPLRGILRSRTKSPKQDVAQLSSAKLENPNLAKWGLQTVESYGISLGVREDPLSFPTVNTKPQLLNKPQHTNLFLTEMESQNRGHLRMKSGSADSLFGTPTTALPPESRSQCNSAEHLLDASIPLAHGTDNSCFVAVSRPFSQEGMGFNTKFVSRGNTEDMINHTRQSFPLCADTLNNASSLTMTEEEKVDNVCSRYCTDCLLPSQITIHSGSCSQSFDQSRSYRPFHRYAAVHSGQHKCSASMNVTSTNGRPLSAEIMNLPAVIRCPSQNLVDNLRGCQSSKDTGVFEKSNPYLECTLRGDLPACVHPPSMPIQSQLTLSKFNSHQWANPRSQSKSPTNMLTTVHSSLMICSEGNIINSHKSTDFTGTHHPEQKTVVASHSSMNNAQVGQSVEKLQHNPGIISSCQSDICCSSTMPDLWSALNTVSSPEVSKEDSTCSSNHDSGYGSHQTHDNPYYHMDNAGGGGTISNAETLLVSSHHNLPLIRQDEHITQSTTDKLPYLPDTGNSCLPSKGVGLSPHSAHSHKLGQYTIHRNGFERSTQQMGYQDGSADTRSPQWTGDNHRRHYWYQRVLETTQELSAGETLYTDNTSPSDKLYNRYGYVSDGLVRYNPLHGSDV